MTIEQQLAERGLRLAGAGERGWFVIVWDNGPKKVWATD